MKRYGCCAVAIYNEEATAGESGASKCCLIANTNTAATPSYTTFDNFDNTAAIRSTQL